MILLWILIGLILLIWLALLQPVWIRVSKSTGRFDLEIRYLWFAIHPLESGDEPEEEQGKDEPEKEKKRRSLGSGSKWLQLIPDILRAVGRSLGYLVKRIMIRQFSGRVRIGFDDPAVTGLAYGYCCGVAHLLPSFVRDRLDLEPNFESEALLFEGDFEGGLRPSSLISTGIVLLWHLPKWRMIRAIRI